MDREPMDSKLKRKTGVQDEPKVDCTPKRQKTSTRSAVKKTRIIDLNDDCMQEIFEYLGPQNLLNVAKASGHFLSAAQSVFGRKFGNNCTTLTNIMGQNVRVRRLMESIGYVQHFGEQMTSLSIEFKPANIERLLTAIVMNCGENVTRLELHHFGVQGKENSTFQENGLNSIRQFLRRLATTFPKLRQLKFVFTNKSKYCPYTSDLVQSLPSLTDFEVDGAFPLDAVTKFIESNPQLLRLCLKNLNIKFTWFLSRCFMECVDRQLPKLEHFEINCVVVDSILTLTPGDFLKNLKSLTFGCVRMPYKIRNGFLALSGELVDQLYLYTFDMYTHLFIERFSNFKNVKHLTLHIQSETEEDAICYCTYNPRVILSIHGIRQLIEHFTKLTTLTIRRPLMYVRDDGDEAFAALFQRYQQVTKNRLNGADWTLSGNVKDHVFSKVNGN